MQRDSAYLLDILESAELILRYVEGRKYQDFATETAFQDQVIRRFQIIGEAARRVSDETRKHLPSIPWRAMIGLRNVLIHEYGEVDPQRLWKTVHEELPQLIAQLRPEVPPPSADV
ncbi:MAG: DUF86 domain-containing protein [Candidatus Eisenbacteria sp.]|nr:DUF86 domain-containing protein [Candidatus Eisenbacteria bacterium]